MPFKALIALILKAATSHNKDTSIIKDKSMTNLQVVTMGQLRQIVD